MCRTELPSSTFNIKKQSNEMKKNSSKEKANCIKNMVHKGVKYVGKEY